MALQAITTVNHAAGVPDIVAVMSNADVGLTDWWVNSGNEQVIVFNGGGAPITVTDTLPSSFQPDGLTVTARTHSIGAGKYAFLGPYPTGIYNSPSQLMTLTWSAVASVKLLVFLRGS